MHSEKHNLSILGFLQSQKIFTIVYNDDSLNENRQKQKYRCQFHYLLIIYLLGVCGMRSIL